MEKINRKIISVVALTVVFGITGCNRNFHDSLSQGQNRPIVHQDEAQSATYDTIAFLSDYREALDISMRDAKPMLVFFTLPNCGSSKKMLETTFCDEEIRRLSTRFVCVRIDGAKESGLCKSNDIQSFPTILFVNPRQQELQRLSGNQSPEQLALQMHVMIQSTAAKVGSVVRK